MPDPRKILVVDWVDRDYPAHPIRAPENVEKNRAKLTTRAAHSLLKIGEGGWRGDGACPTLGDVADLTWAQVSKCRN